MTKCYICEKVQDDKGKPVLVLSNLGIQKGLQHVCIPCALQAGLSEWDGLKSIPIVAFGSLGGAGKKRKPHDEYDPFDPKNDATLGEIPEYHGSGAKSGLWHNI
jgi:hypothetical protein